MTPAAHFHWRHATRASVAALFVALCATSALFGATATAQSTSPGTAVTVLLFHPNDGVDPLGFPYAGSDPFTARYGPFADEDGRFAYPFFVADGAIPIAGIPDPNRPYDSARQAYADAVRSRTAEQSPVTLQVASTLTEGALLIAAQVIPGTSLEGEDLHVWFAIAEDPVHYQPPAGLTNGIVDHRFTVRAIWQGPRLDFATEAPRAEWTQPTANWNRERLIVAAWVQQGTPSSRFDAHEIVQATHAPAGQSVSQTSKGVLMEVLSATWCDPCLYGDLAAESLAIELGSAQALEPTRTRYFEWPANPLMVGVLSLAVGLAIGAAARRKLT